MSGLFPTDLPPSSLRIRSVQPTLVSVTHSLQRQVRSRGGQRWQISASWSGLSRADWARLFGFAMAQRGQYGTFQFQIPQIGSARGMATGTPLVAGASQSGRTVTTDGWTAGVTGILKAGDLVKFAGHAKIYMLTEDVDSNGSGQATLVIEPALMEAPADNEAIDVSDVQMTVAFADDVRESQVGAVPVYDFSAELVEVP